MIKENVFKIKERILSICSKTNRNPDTITIVAVSKDRTPEQIKEVIETGITDIGENKIQEAILKYNNLTPNTQYPIPIKWHMVGHLQTNKVKEAIRIFDLIHSVDSIHLAAEINKQAARINKIQDILIQVNTSSKGIKFGLKPDETIEVIKEIAKLKNLNIKGLMTIASIVDDPEKTRPYFRMLRELRDEIGKFGIWKLGFGILSMGMTDDFEVAIEEDANMLRLGRAIFSRQ
jgi:hypothetical protein